MVRYARAVREDIPALKELWLCCFEEKPEAAELFFERTMSFTRAYKATTGERIVAAVYCVGCSLDGKPAHYLCGVATHPDFRGRGVMRGLMRFALADAEERGDAYSVLFPANEGLYRFYGLFGYKNRCGVGQIELTRDEPGEGEASDRVFPDTDELQRRCLQNNFLFWNKDFIRFAADYYAVYGVRTLFSDGALAIVDVENGTAKVIYAVYRDNESLKNLLLQLKADRYILIRRGGCLPYGMVKPLGGNPLPDNVFIGITLN